jgi:hypothetical protein
MASSIPKYAVIHEEMFRFAQHDNDFNVLHRNRWGDPCECPRYEALQVAIYADPQ